MPGKADLFPIWYALPHGAGWDRYNVHDLQSHMLPRLDLYCADPAQPLTAAGEALDDLNHDLSDLSVMIYLMLSV